MNVTTILFPFTAHSSFAPGYAWATELASRMDAAIVFLCMDEENEESNSAMYQALLEATGFYLRQYFPGSGNYSRPAQRVERAHHATETEIAQKAEGLTPSIVVLDPKAMPPWLNIGEIVLQVRAAIALPDRSDVSESFEMLLSKAALYNIPGDLRLDDSLNLSVG